MLRTLRALSVTIAACWFCAAAASAAERGAAMRFDIPAQSLDGALNAFAEAAGVQLSYRCAVRGTPLTRPVRPLHGGSGPRTTARGYGPRLPLRR